MIKTYKFVAALYLLSDILPQLSKLSLVFQHRDVDFSMIQPVVSATIATIESFSAKPGPFLSQMEDVLAGELAPFLIEVTATAQETFKSMQDNYITIIIANLKRRFPDVALLNAFQIFIPSKAPSTSADAFSNYGLTQLNTLLDHYSPDVVSREACEQEWLQYKQLMTTSYSTLSMKESIDVLLTNPTMSSLFPHLAKLASIAIIIPVSTADCERGFSCMNRVKTDLRNRLKTETLDQLLRISIEGPPPRHYNFDRAATLWGSWRNRRINVWTHDNDDIVQLYMYYGITFCENPYNSQSHFC